MFGRCCNLLNRFKPVSLPHIFKSHLASQSTGSKSRARTLPALISGAAVGTVFIMWGYTAQAREATSSPNNTPKLYSMADVAKHDSKSTGIWVVYKGGVYDITNFVDQHPGGTEKIMLAAGGDIEPFWNLYQQHYTEQIHNILESFRIGDLNQNEVQSQAVDTSDPFADEPQRSTLLRVISKKPFNAEAPPSLLAEQFITPTELFFIRNHLPVPTIDMSTYKIEIEDSNGRMVELSLDDLKQKFKKHTITAVLQCSGNRRQEMHQIRPIKGLDWSQGAVGNAEWSGVSLCDVLSYAGFDCAKPDPKVHHVQFEGHDQDVTGIFITAASVIDRTDMQHKALAMQHQFL